MKHLCVVLLLFVTHSISISSQSLEVATESQFGPFVRVSGLQIAIMCENFVREFRAVPERGMISIKPKTLPLTEIENTGAVWVARIGAQEIEIESIELPAPLRNLKGRVARLVIEGTCYTKEQAFVSTHDVRFKTSNLTEAQLIAEIIRGN